jgi:hypothetical protein
MPNRGWNSEEARWIYMPVDQHDRDVAWVVRVAKWRAEQKEQQEKEEAQRQSAAAV